MSARDFPPKDRRYSIHKDEFEFIDREGLFWTPAKDPLASKRYSTGETDVDVLEMHEFSPQDLLGKVAFWVRLPGNAAPNMRPVLGKGVLLSPLKQEHGLMGTVAKTDFWEMAKTGLVVLQQTTVVQFDK